MTLDDFKKSLKELSVEELTDLMREVRLSRTKPKASNIKRKQKAEKKGPTKNQIMNLLNALDEDEVKKLLAQMEADNE